MPEDSRAQIADLLDRDARSRMARATSGLSPAAIMDAWDDWRNHLVMSPGKRGELIYTGVENWMNLSRYAIQYSLGFHPEDPITPNKGDRRWRHAGWDRPPFNFYKQSFLLAEDWWHDATTGIRGMSPQSENATTFMVRQVLDAFAPTNFPATNPEIIEATVKENGMNFLRGAQNYFEDLKALTTDSYEMPMNGFKVGENLAVTPGKVVFRNHLIELIQYTPTTDKVHPEPILITPAWIMKYYILDLSPENSMVKYLTDQGHTVFMISWRNPDKEDRDLAMLDYLEQGSMAALDEVTRITGADKVHLTGYCLGGTLSIITAARMARDGDDRLASLTLFAAQADFTEAGELMLFINESQVAFLEDMMWRTGYLDAKQMAGAFQLLRSNDLIWSQVQRQYMLGERTKVNDLMAWNADTTRMPYKMHSEYLRELFLSNKLATGKYRIDGHHIFVSDIRVPIFAVGTETDHVAPWRSVYKIEALTQSEVTFVLTNGGHNAGVVSEPGHPRRHYRVMTHAQGDNHLSSFAFEQQAEKKDGSWWPEWSAWLTARSGAPGKPPKMARALCDAPGTYVMMP